MRLKTWILVPMTIAIGIGLFFWGAFYFQQEKEASRQATTRLVSQGQDYYSSLLQQQVRLLQAHAEYLIRNQELIGAWHNRDRDALLELTVPLASEFQQKYKITHFYLVEPDRTVFLRPYNPSRTGGVISRQTMLQAQASGVAVHGLELGSLATLTLRYVTPWYDQDELLGFIELGMETEHILQEMAKMLHVDLISVIRKEFIRRESFEAGTERFGFKGNWDDYPDMVIAHQTISDLPDALHDWLVTGHDAFFGPNNIYAVHRGRHLWGGIIHKPDIAGEDVADLIIIHDATAQMMALRHSMVTNFGVATMLLGSLLLLLYSVTRRAEKAIETAHKQLQTKNSLLDSLSKTDQLTGIANRRRTQQVIEQEIDRFNRYKKPFCIFLFDIDHFKTVNDTHGHEVGDQVLVELVGLVQSVIRRTDTFGRWGGEEFILVCPETSLPTAQTIAGKICTTVREYKFTRDLRITLSIGVSEIQSGATLKEILVEVDRKMYLAKQKGRNRVEV